MAGGPNTGPREFAGRYRVVRRLGAGGMASVFLAEDERLGRLVAIKRVHTASPEDTLKRFQREAKLGASVTHPGLVAVYDSISEDDAMLIIMEYVEGESLAERLRRGPVPPQEALPMLAGIGDAIDHLHRHGVLHRDIKPANVLLTTDGEAKLADLGIATATDLTSITGTSAVMGSLPYMAPERLRGGDVDERSDVFAFAVTAFQTLAGRRAHEASTPEEQIREAMRESAPDLNEAWPNGPAATIEVLAAAMDASPAARPASARILVEDLAASFDDGTEGIPTEPMAPPTPPRPHPVARQQPPPRPDTLPRSGQRRAPKWGAIAAVVLAIVAIGGIAIATSGDDNGSSGNRASPSGRQANSGATAPNPQPEANEEPAVADTPDPAPDPAPVPVPETDPVELNNRGKALLDAGDYSGAIPLLQQAVDAYEPGSQDLNYAYALYNLGNAYRLNGQPEEAIPILRERLSIPNQTAEVQAELDLAYADAGVTPEEAGSGGGVGPGDEDD